MKSERSGNIAVNRKRKTILLLGLAIVLALLLGVVWRCAAPPPQPPTPFAWENTLYVWQRQWTDQMKRALAKSGDHCDGYWILSSETRYEAPLFEHTLARPDWAMLGKSGQPVTLTMRMGLSCKAALESREGREKAGDGLMEIVKAHREEATKAGVTIAGIQLDYDCPSARLKDYGLFLEELAERLTEKTALSITALPTWLRYRAFKGLLALLDYVVLQVHHLEKPNTVADVGPLWEVEKAAAWAGRMNQFGRPFYLALPTYGYRLLFDEEERFLGLTAENGLPAFLPVAYKTQTVMARPEPLAKWVKALKTSPPAWCKGLAWFRHPVESDQLNWPWETLEAVMAGRIPRHGIEVEFRNISEGLFEIWLYNGGERRYWRPLRYQLKWPGRYVEAGHQMPEYATVQQSAEGLILAGPAPDPGVSRLAAWFRLSPGSTPLSGIPLYGDKP